MSPSYRGTRLEIREGVIEQNVRALKALVGRGFFCPMVKANAYGHGVEKIVPVMKKCGVENLGVATWDEALELRSLSYDREILVFSRTHSLGEARLAVEGKFTPVVSRFEDLEVLSREAERARAVLPIHVKFDTGIHRMGFSLEQKDEVLRFFKGHAALKLSGVLTHLSHSEDASQAQGHSDGQLKKFFEAAVFFKEFNPHLHALNSSGILGLSKKGQDLKDFGGRPGIALYGDVGDERLSEVSALRVVSQLDHLRRLPKGEGVSYGWTWRASKDSLVGVVPFGYGDGYPRGLGNKAFMLYRGQRVPVVGTVCMDYVLVDLTEVDLKDGGPPRLGEEVVILGEQGNQKISPRELAGWNNTISYEILTGMGLRKNRVEVL
jgi:alanine racemase